MLSQRSNGICVVTHKSLLSSSLLCGVVCSSGTRKEEQGYCWDYACRVYVHARVLGTDSHDDDDGNKLHVKEHRCN